MIRAQPNKKNKRTFNERRFLKSLTKKNLKRVTKAARKRLLAAGRRIKNA